MKALKRLLAAFIIFLSPYACAQKYYFYDSSGKLEYYKDSRWVEVKEGETILSSKSVVRCDALFEVVDFETKKIHNCPPSKGAALLTLLDKYKFKKTDPGYTWVKDGRLDVMNADSNLVFADSLESIALHYLIVDIHQFEDDAWQNIGAPNIDANKLEKAIRNNLIPSNKLHVGYSKLLNQIDNTTLVSIRSAFNELLSSVKEDCPSYVIIYLSSHGLVNKNNEFVMVTSNSSLATSSLQSESFLHEDEINEYIRKLNRKNAKILLFIDACRSGTIIRNLNKDDDLLKGDVAYFTSTSNDLSSYQTVKGSPFATALTRAINGEERIYFKKNNDMVTPYLLELYLRDYVSKNQMGQDPISVRGIKMFPHRGLWALPDVMSKASLEELRNAADYGNTVAMIELASYYAKEDTIAQHTSGQDSVFFYLKKAYNLMDRNAIVPLALCYYNGIGVEKNYKEAFELFKMGSAKGFDLANYYLSVCYTKGYYVKKNKKKAKSYMSKIKNYMNPDIIKASQYEGVPIVGVFNNNGTYISKVGMVQLSKKSRYPQPTVLGSLLDEDKGDIITYSISTGTYTTNGKLQGLYSDAQQKDPSIQAEIGYRCLKKKDYPKALYWLEQSSQRNEGKALYYLFEMYSKGLGIQSDEKRAYEYLERAANQKYLDAYVELGNSYFFGKNGIQSDEKAFFYWKLAAQKNHCTAQYKVGICYKDGIGVTPNESLSFSWLRKSSSNESNDGRLGRSWAKYELGCYYLSKKIYKKAYDLLTESANLNNYKAQEILSRYFHGNGEIRSIE